MDRLHPADDHLVRDCLVGVVRADSDLEHFRSDHWYRVPERAIGHTLSASVLDETSAIAVYQSGRIKSGLPGAIEHWGPVDRVDLQLRRELIPAEPDHERADDLYYCFRIARLHRLDHPITSLSRRRMNFIRTTRNRLLEAKHLQDLYIGSAVEEHLYRRLRDEVGDVDRRVLMVSDGVGMEVDFAVYDGGRALGIICRDHVPTGLSAQSNPASAWGILRFTPIQIERDFSSCLDEILRMVAGTR